MKKSLFCFAFLVMIMMVACSPTPMLGEKVSEKDGMVLVYVQEGKFKMGRDDAIAPDQGPMHAVSLDSFWIDKTEVTNQMYEKCVEAGTCEAPAKSGSYTRDSYYGTLSSSHTLRTN